MACHGVQGNFVIIDCAACGGQGHIIILPDNFPPRKETCKICEGTCVVRIPIIKVPVLGEKS